MSLSDSALNRACAEIYRRWLRFVPEPEALAQAEGFRRRCETLAGDGVLTEAELDSTLVLIADCMGMAV